MYIINTFGSCSCNSICVVVLRQDRKEKEGKRKISMGLSSDVRLSCAFHAKLLVSV
jgi:hypothetical protein